MLLKEEQHEVSQEDQVADDLGVTAASFVFEQTGILAPVIADFHARPMSAHGLQPLRGRFGNGGPAAEVIGIFPVGGFLFTAGLSADVNDRLYMREVNLQRIDAFYRDVPVGLASVFFFEKGKRGERSFMPASAMARTVFWLSLTWIR